MKSQTPPCSSKLVSSWLLGVTFFSVASLNGCNSASSIRPEQNISPSEQTIPAGSQKLDIAISNFGSHTDDVDAAEFPEIREAEAKYIPQKVKTALQEQKVWGAVRVVPNNYDLMDLRISGEILVSDGDHLSIRIVAQDATGNVWVKKTYEKRVNPTTYDSVISEEIEPCHILYAEVANDLLAALHQIPDSQKNQIKAVSELQFAQEFEPKVFEGYLGEAENGLYQPVRLPAHEDPDLRRIREIRTRNSMFLDILQIEYENFASRINQAYYEWRKEGFKEKRRYRNAVAKSRNLIFKGTVQAFRSLNPLTLFKLISNPAAPVGASYAIKQIESGLDMRREAGMRQEGLRELAASLNEFVRSHNVSIGERTIDLTGTLDERYDEFRRILDEIYSIEQPLDRAINSARP